MAVACLNSMSVQGQVVEPTVLRNIKDHTEKTAHAGVLGNCSLECSYVGHGSGDGVGGVDCYFLFLGITVCKTTLSRFHTHTIPMIRFDHECHKLHLYASPNRFPRNQTFGMVKLSPYNASVPGQCTG